MKRFSTNRIIKNSAIILCSLFVVHCSLNNAYAAEYSELDTENPLFLGRTGDVLSKTGMDFGDDILAVRQYLSVGVTDKFELNGFLNWQNDFDGPRDGFSYSGFGAKYRFSNTDIISDFTANIKFGGAARVPEYADTVYTVGLRVGKQWSRITLAAKLETSWIFHEDYGMAYIDLTPEFYARVFGDWYAGANAMLRKATNPHFDQEWLGGKIVRQYGRTMYTGFAEYEFEQSDFRFGFRVNILF